MEHSIYFATELMSALIILILIFANNYQIKHNSKKRALFNWMLVLNEIAVLSDAVTYFPFPWQRLIILFNIVMGVTFLVPSLIKMVFTVYFYIHISERTPVSKKPFIFIHIYCMVEFFIILFLCLTGRLFYLEDGVYYAVPEGSLIYSILTIVSMAPFFFLIFKNAKKLGVHDTLVILPYIVIPIVSLVVAVFTGFVPSVIILSFNMLFMYVTIQSEHEKYLYTRANIDELTGLFNRRAYEEDIKELKENAKKNLVYASFDLNELKSVNDSLGHEAGDELIQGAAHCIKQAFGGTGKIYRMGGDEFAAIFFPDGNNFKFEILRDSFTVFTQEWKGAIVDSLTISAGYATQKEFPDEDIVGLSKIADKRMYDAKNRYYASKGVDRRGQSNAYKALFKRLYLKILKINITDDSYSVIDISSNEKMTDNGSTNSIFDWLKHFAKSGQIHPDDMETFLLKTSPDYMRDHFRNGNSMMWLSYRRKHGEEFKSAIMEIIPTNEYSHDNQILYLYVKNV